MSLIEQLINFHRSETWHNNELSDAELVLYFECVISKGRILLCQDSEDQVLGYVESWRINFEQFGRKLCHEPILVDTEDIQNGKIAYVANTHILPEYRNSWVRDYLKMKFFKQNYSAQYFVGEAIRKKSGVVKVFTRDRIASIISGIKGVMPHESKT